MERCAVCLVLCLVFAPDVLWPQQAEPVEISREVLEAHLHLAEPENAKRSAKLVELFAKAGCTGPNLTIQPFGKSGPANVICKLPGETPETIIVGAHHDAKNGPGVADNWAGASLLPLLYSEMLTLPRRRHTFLFVGFAEEEIGLLGSRHFVAQMTAADRRNGKAMVNLDTLGLGLPKVWFSRSDQTLMNLYAVAASALNVPLGAANYERVGSTDSESFTGVVPRITISSITDANIRLLHSGRDKLSEIRLDDYVLTARLVQRYLRVLDEHLE